MKNIDIAVERVNIDLPEEMEGKISGYMAVYDKCLNTYIEKNIDYGDSFSKIYNQFGILSSAIRLQDKINRLCSLVKNNETLVEDESIKDTLEDTINYCVMTLMKMNENRAAENEGNFAK